MHPHPDTSAENAALLLSSLLRNCTRLLPKFAPGSAQYSLLQNRIAALTLALRLLRDGPGTARCSRAALRWKPHCRRCAPFKAKRTRSVSGTVRRPRPAAGHRRSCLPCPCLLYTSISDTPP